MALTFETVESCARSLFRQVLAKRDRDETIVHTVEYVNRHSNLRDSKSPIAVVDSGVFGDALPARGERLLLRPCECGYEVLVVEDLVLGLVHRLLH